MKQFKVYGHRGYAEKYPENTLLAFRQAFEYGADGIECDLQKSGDGHYILLHDDTVDRTALNRQGHVTSMSLAGLQTCDLGNGQTIPRLEEMLETIPAGKFLDLELKPETISQADCPVVLEIVLRHLKKEQLMISSNDPALLSCFKKKGITTGFIIEEKSRQLGVRGVLHAIFKYNPDYLNLPVQIFSELGLQSASIFIRIMQLCGKRILFWTVNNEDDLTNALRFTKDIVTDRVELINGCRNFLR